MFLFIVFFFLPVFAIVEEESKQVQVGSAEFWSQIVAIICLVILSGIIAGTSSYPLFVFTHIFLIGLTLGLVSKKKGGDRQEMITLSF